MCIRDSNLEDEIKNGRFREDLFYRLSVIELNIPPLRERREDILPLAARFIEEFAKGRARFSDTVSASLKNYLWPGNVRELRNAMERAALLSHSEFLLPEHLPTRVRAAAGQSSTPAPADLERLDEIERQAILHTLRQHGFNRTETARTVSYTHLDVYKRQFQSSSTSRSGTSSSQSSTSAFQTRAQNTATQMGSGTTTTTGTGSSSGSGGGSTGGRQY